MLFVFKKNLPWVSKPLLILLSISSKSVIFVELLILVLIVLGRTSWPVFILLLEE